MSADQQNRGVQRDQPVSERRKLKATIDCDENDRADDSGRDFKNPRHEIARLVTRPGQLGD